MTQLLIDEILAEAKPLAKLVIPGDNVSPFFPPLASRDDEYDAWSEESGGGSWGDNWNDSNQHEDNWSDSV